MTRRTDRQLHLEHHRPSRPFPPGPRRRLPVVLILGLSTFSALALPARASAADDAVTNCSGSASVAGSLPFVVAGAAPGDTVDFTVSCPPSSPIILSSTLDIGVALTINGPGPSSMAVSGDNDVTVLAVASGVSTTLSGITIEDGLGSAGGGIDNAGSATVTDSTIADNTSSDGGGGIANENGTLTMSDSSVADDNTYRGGGGGIEVDGGSVTVSDSTLSHDHAYFGGITIGGGAIENLGGTVAVTDSTFAQNVSDYNGGGGAVFNGGGTFNDGGVVDLTASTLAHNVTHRQGGGGGGNIENELGTVSMAGTIVSNSAVTRDCSGSVIDAGYNLDDDGSCGLSVAHHSQSDVKPYLGPLQQNGGLTDTLAPAIGSPVLNQIPVGATGNDQSLCPGTDQRGVARPQGSACDLGAVELSPSADTITSPDATAATLHSQLSFTVTTSGTPTPVITKSGMLPKRITFIDNGDGTATLSGQPTTAGRFRLEITATFGAGPSAFAVVQLFTLTVNAT